VRCWGFVGYGALGYGNAHTTSATMRARRLAGDLPLPQRALSLSLGAHHSCALSTKGFPAGARAERSARLRQHQHHRQRNRRQRRLRASPIVARSHMSGRVAALVRSESLACGRAGDVAWPRVVSGRRQRSHWVGLFRARVGCVSGRFGVSVEVGRGGRQHAPTPRSCRRTRCRM
jgi:hypothetical protein